MWLSTKFVLIGTAFFCLLGGPRPGLAQISASNYKLVYLPMPSGFSGGQIASGYSSTSGFQLVGQIIGTNKEARAAIWPNGGTSAANIDSNNTVQYNGSSANAGIEFQGQQIQVGTQVGPGSAGSTGPFAGSWQGPGAFTRLSGIDPGQSSSALGASLTPNGIQVVGDQGGYSIATSAVVWSGPSLNSLTATYLSQATSGYANDRAVAAASSGGVSVQVGFVGATGGPAQAMLWKGSAASAMNLTPGSSSNAEALGVGVGASGSLQEVGFANIVATGDVHAALWSGTSGSYVDINPAGFTYSEAVALNGGLAVGDGLSPGTYPWTHALLWSSSNPAKFADLGTLVPVGRSGVPQSSYATAVDSNGNVFGYLDDQGGRYPVEFVNMAAAAPEPGAAGIFLMAFGLLTKRRCRR
jgi:hypothetical protein